MYTTYCHEKHPDAMNGIGMSLRGKTLYLLQEILDRMQDVLQLGRFSARIVPGERKSGRRHDGADSLRLGVDTWGACIVARLSKELVGG